MLCAVIRIASSYSSYHHFIEDRKDVSKLSLNTSWPGPQRVELPLSWTNFYTPKDVRVIGVRLYKGINSFKKVAYPIHLSVWYGYCSRSMLINIRRIIQVKLLRIVRLSLLTMTNPNQLCDVVLFVCFKMSDKTNLSSKLPVADRTREVWGRKLFWWCPSSGLPLCTFLLGFADSFCFVFTSSPSYEASRFCTILCNPFPWLCWYVKVLKGGFEGVLVSLCLTTMGVFSNL